MTEPAPEGSTSPGGAGASAAAPGVITVGWVPLGAAGTAALADAVGEAQAGDRLAPVTVLTPTPAVAVATRRRLARRGTANVTFASLAQVAELLAATRLALAGRPGLDVVVLRAAVRRVLAADPGPFAEVAEHPATEERLARLALAVAPLDPSTRAALAARPDLAGAAARVAAAALAHVAGFVAPHEIVAHAVAEVTERPDAARALGSVLVYLPESLAPHEATLVGALGRAVPVRVLLGATGDGAVDGHSRAVAQVLGVEVPAPPAPAPAPAPTAVTSAPDPDDEVRIALGRLLGLVDEGVPLANTALLYTAAEPYARIVADRLTEAGVPFTGPSTARLSATVAGRVVRGARACAAGADPRLRLARDAVIDLVAGVPSVTADGRPVPAGWWDRLSREAGVVAGRDQWAQRMARLAERKRRRADELTGPDTPDADDAGESVDPAAAERRAHRAARLRDDASAAEELAAFVESLAEALAPEAEPASWSEVAPWVGRLVDLVVGPRHRWVSWPDHEVAAADRLLDRLRGLAVVDAVEPHPTPAVVGATLDAELSLPAPRRPTPGGMLVAPLESGVGLDAAAVAIVGLVEGSAPLVAREDPLLPDAARVAAGLPPASEAVLRQRRGLRAALAGGADARFLSWSRGDPRRGRTQVPSRWLLEAVCGIAPQVTATALMAAGPGDLPWLEVVPSFVGGLGASGPHLSLAERDLAVLAPLAEAGGDGPVHHPLVGEPRLAAALAVIEARRSGRFTRFDGNLGGVSVSEARLGVAAGAVHSPTALETWATCPRRYLFARVLGLDEIDRPEAIDRLAPMDRGNIVHRALEAVVQGALERGDVPAPGEPWSEEHHRRLDEVLAEVFAEFEQRGLTGEPLYWEHDRAALGSEAHAVLRRDDERRAEERTVPVAVEHRFGLPGEPPLEIEVAPGRVLSFAGVIDRVDLGPDRVHVYDYKTGSDSGFKGLGLDDPVHGGRKLQLPLYARAAQQRWGRPVATVGYWLTQERHRGRIVGYEYGPDQDEAFLAALATITDGITAGRFPARPGEDSWYHGRPESCTHCPFHRICPSERREEWERVRRQPELAAYAALAEPGALDDGEGADRPGDATGGQDG